MCVFVCTPNVCASKLCRATTSRFEIHRPRCPRLGPSNHWQVADTVAKSTPCWVIQKSNSKLRWRKCRACARRKRQNKHISTKSSLMCRDKGFPGYGSRNTALCTLSLNIKSEQSASLRNACVLDAFRAPTQARSLCFQVSGHPTAYRGLAFQQDLGQSGAAPSRP